MDLIFQKAMDGTAEVGVKGRVGVGVGGVEGNELEEFIFPSDFSGLTHISDMHVVRPKHEYLFLITEYLRLKRDKDPKHVDVNEKVHVCRGYMCVI